MKKLFDKIKKNNKGFTLVELIVVIAVLAIITVVVAPQYLNYVEKARIGTDENTLGEIAHVAEIAYVELESKTNTSTTATTTDGAVKVVIDENGNFTYEQQGTANTLDSEVAKVIKPATSGENATASQYKFKSKTYKGKSVEITVSNGVANWTPQTPVN